MGVNFSSFEIGRRALRASQYGMELTGQNIANVNTAGYSRKGIQQSAVPPASADVRLSGGGVSIDGVRSFRDRLVESRLQTETSISGRLTAQRDALAPVDSVLAAASGDGGIQSALNTFFNAFGDLEAHPESVPLRAAVVDAGNALGSTFASTRNQLSDSQLATDGSIRSAVDDANRLAAQVADLNERIKITANTNGGVEELVDQRAEAIRGLADLLGVRTTDNTDGTVTVTLGDGRALVNGKTAATLQSIDTAPNGFATVTLDASPATISDGRVRGLLNARDEIGRHITSLDDLAASVADRVNTTHASGSDLTGADGGVFFAIPASGPITAANLRVDGAVAANPRLVVASGRGAGIGDSTVARSLANLLTDPSSTAGSHTGSFGSIFASIVSDAGNGIRTLDDSLATQLAILSQTNAQRDALAGVSLDEEAVNLLQYQRAYEAAARFLKVADEMTQAILALGQ